MFDLSKEQSEIKKAVREFAEAEFSDIAREKEVEKVIIAKKILGRF